MALEGVGFLSVGPLVNPSFNIIIYRDLAS